MESISLVSALLLGIIEGLTEFIPVSSTGHIVLLGNMVGMPSDDKAKFFDIFIQLGGISAAVLIYWRYYAVLFFKNFRTEETDGFVGFLGISKIIFTMVPACFLGLIFHKQIKSLMEPEIVAIALIVGGILLIVCEKFCKTYQVTKTNEITLRQSILIGFFQALALWPGMSRSGSTIIGARLLGFERQVAANFSFIIAVPIMVAAVGLDIIKNISALSFEDVPAFSIGFFVSFIVGFLSIKIFLKVLEKFTLSAFGYYRIILGLIVLLCF